MLDGCLTAQLTATLKNRIYFYRLKLKTNSLDSFSKGIFYYNGYLNMKNKFYLIILKLIKEINKI